MFVTRDRLILREELTEQGKKKILLEMFVAKDSKSRALFAHVAKKKGADEDGYAVKRLAEDIEWPGYTGIIVKSDCKRAIVSPLK